MDRSTRRAGVTLEGFADRVGCHFTTASRLKAGQRMPGRQLFGRIVQRYGLDPIEALRVYTGGSAEQFGAYLREEIFDFEGEMSVNRDSDDRAHHRRLAV
jgi:transcriptional regulator with XRE-family HTH domain